MKVIIEQIKIIEFGKLKDFTLDLKDGFNVIYGENESGKSTIQLFIKAMLYGMPSRKRADEVIKERERAIPWDGSKASGVLRLLADAKQIEIRRTFGKTSAGDKFEACNALTGEILSEYTADNIGEKLLGIPAEVFERTLFIRQNKISANGRCDELTKRLMNLKATGDEGVSAESAIENLEKEKRRLKAKDKRSVRGKIDELTDKIEELKREKYDLLRQMSQNDEAEKRLAGLKIEITDIKKKEEILNKEFFDKIEFEKDVAKRERLKRIDECDIKIKELTETSDFKKGKGINADLIEEAQSLEKKLFENQGVSRNQNNIFFALGAVAVIAAVILWFVSGIAAFVTALIVGAVFAGFGVKTLNTAKNIKIEQAKKLKERLKNILEDYGAESSEELLRIHTSFVGKAAQIESLKQARQGFLGDDTYEDLKSVKIAEETSEKSATEIERELSLLRKRLPELSAEIKALELGIAYETKITKIPADIDTEILALSEEIEVLNQRYSACEKAQQIIREAQEVWKSETLPQLNEKVDFIIKKLTNNKYQNIKVLSDYKMRFNADNSFYDAEYLSFGAYEQIYLALRIATAELICEELPVFLDDILTSYDDERTKNAIECLGDLDERQIVLFTCHKSDAEFAEKTRAYTFNI